LTSELIAFHKSPKEIADAISADALIYQELDDLKAACTELSRRDPATQEFEVGVFCGMYVSHVEDDYFEHLERIRGKRKRQKIEENGRQAVLKGVASEEEMRLATNDATVDRLGQVVSAVMG